MPNINDIAICLVESLILSNDEERPEYKFSNIEAWEEWSDIKHVYNDILDQINNGGNAYEVIETYADKMLHLSNVSSKHEYEYLALHFRCEEILDMLCESEHLYFIESDENLMISSSND